MRPAVAVHLGGCSGFHPHAVSDVGSDVIWITHNNETSSIIQRNLIAVERRD
jgi:hypothetical protein